MPDRYEVHEITGYGVGGQYKSTSICVLDSDYCFREVATFNHGNRGGPSVHHRRARARELCDRLNAEDAQAREGTGA